MQAGEIVFDRLFDEINFRHGFRREGNAMDKIIETDDLTTEGGNQETRDPGINAFLFSLRKVDGGKDDIVEQAIVTGRLIFLIGQRDFNAQVKSRRTKKKRSALRMSKMAFHLLVWLYDCHGRQVGKGREGRNGKGEIKY